MKFCIPIVVTMVCGCMQGIKIDQIIHSHEITAGQNDTQLLQTLSDNSLFNEISGYKPTGGLIGSFFGYVSDTVDKWAGLRDDVNDNML